MTRASPLPIGPAPNVQGWPTAYFWGGGGLREVKGQSWSNLPSCCTCAPIPNPVPKNKPKCNYLGEVHGISANFETLGAATLWLSPR